MGVCTKERKGVTAGVTFASFPVGATPQVSVSRSAPGDHQVATKVRKSIWASGGQQRFLPETLREKVGFIENTARH